VPFGSASAPVESTETGSLTVSSVVAHELYFGVYRSRFGFILQSWK